MTDRTVRGVKHRERGVPRVRDFEESIDPLERRFSSHLSARVRRRRIESISAHWLHVQDCAGCMPSSDSSWRTLSALPQFRPRDDNALVHNTRSHVIRRSSSQEAAGRRVHDDCLPLFRHQPRCGLRSRVSPAVSRRRNTRDSGGPLGVRTQRLVQEKLRTGGGAHAPVAQRGVSGTSA